MGKKSRSKTKQGNPSSGKATLVGSSDILSHEVLEIAEAMIVSAINKLRPLSQEESMGDYNQLFGKFALISGSPLLATNPGIVLPILTAKALNDTVYGLFSVGELEGEPGELLLSIREVASEGVLGSLFLGGLMLGWRLHAKELK